jgi:hypothetical protein
MKFNYLVISLLLLMTLTSCTSSSCPEGSITYLDDINQFPADTSAEQTFDKVDLEIKVKTLTFDRVIDGPVCNDTWEGTIYVSCDIQLLKWETKPFFFTNGCNLEIKPDTVVYVAAHNNSAYYKGCISCH